MKVWIILMVLAISGCDNNTYSASPGFSLFETSSGVVYLINQSTGELEVISSKKTLVLSAGQIFRDSKGNFFKYLGDGETEKIESLVEK
ncbi:hypothetical protein KFJ24_02425 [Marinobacter sediminum]|uniref:hypothetical protein n=1 Tax=Marinobacter sediminum TaxID=256323 RepID=UPI00202E9927|nr:hypothetical protein [Marinobacter sediminum]MCM0611329.1 hypothetical protein [Marinobacter sediminum]